MIGIGWASFMAGMFQKVLSVAAVAAMTVVALAPSAMGVTASAAGASIRCFVTSNDKKCAEAGTVSFHAASNSDKSAPDSVTVSGTKKQEVLGFGAAFTDAACYNLKDLLEESRAKLFKDLFSPSEMGLSVCRICIGASDYSTKVYSYDEGEPDPDMKRFSIDHDRQYILPILKEARKVNPDLFLLASPWSPPGWMKPNNSMLGGNIQRKSFEPYAKYFVKFLKAYEEAGVPVQAVSVQNEVDTDQDGRMPACLFPQEYEMDFVRQNLGPSIAKENLKTKIWIIDHNYNLWGRAVDMLEGDDMFKYVGGVAWHGYVGSPELMTRVHKAFPNVDMYWTEGGPDYTWPDYATDWVKWSKSFSGILNNWCKSIIAWNLSLDEAGKPNIGPFP
ncbi:MAG: hypothetical protein K2X29_11280, partial [Candidatus Obscuribacterales bacterium]|nr:hypothetical protein [Candidatus Obscuribacterales bacterium]